VSSQTDKTDQPDGGCHNLIQEAVEDVEASVPKEDDHDNMLSEMNSQPDGECHNLIQEALEFSSIDLGASNPKEADDNLLSEMNTSFSNLDLNLGELSQISTPMQQIEVPNLSENMGNEDVHISGSHIWTSLSPVERQELELGLVSPSEMNSCHKIIPKCNKTATRNPDTFNPQKVIYC
jgi:hypothetical protein